MISTIEGWVGFDVAERNFRASSAIQWPELERRPAAVFGPCVRVASGTTIGADYPVALRHFDVGLRVDVRKEPRLLRP